MGKFKDYIQQLDCNCLYQTPSVQVKPNATWQHRNTWWALEQVKFMHPLCT
jgi:hypothetical protein